MKKRYGFLWTMISMLGLLAACDDSATSMSREPNEEKLGELSMNLVGVDSDGRQYRLRDATFDIQEGYTYYPYPPYYDGGSADAGFSTSVSTETDPDAPVISLRVVEGSYYIALGSTAWYIERLQAGVWTRVEQVALLSSPYQYAYVYSGGTTTVAFRFGVDGELIDFRGGNLQIGIEIEQPGDVPDGGFFGDSGFGIDGGAAF